MKEREEIFCRYFLRLQNPKEAAIRAGYSHLFAEKTAQKLLMRDDVIAFLEREKKDYRRSELLGMAIKGLRRLAFSRPNDAVLLALKSDELDEKSIEHLDLFSVSDLKKQRDGGFEFKFADRIKALEALGNLADRTADDDAAGDFLRALANQSEEMPCG